MDRSLSNAAAAAASRSPVASPTALLEGYLAECRSLVLNEIRSIVPRNRYGSVLYDLMLEYPLRLGKGFRPALCIAVCRALGGRLHDVLRTAAVIELFHNGFLIHDDVEDASELRRGQPTLHRDHGIPIAVNVGDGIFALCLQPLLDNMRLLGVGKALRILETVARMTRESVEGQALELDWVRHGRFDLSDRDYCRMSYKKTCWYTFIAPLTIGAVVAGAGPRELKALERYGTYIGIAFQIQDDVLNLVADEGLYGKESKGDLLEGKHTIMLLHMMRTARPSDRRRAQRILDLSRQEKTREQAAWLYELIRRCGSVEYACGFAGRLATKALADFAAHEGLLPESLHRDFLHAMAGHVIARDR